MELEMLLKSFGDRQVSKEEKNAQKTGPARQGGVLEHKLQH